MAVAAPKRRSSAATAPAPSRTAPPKRKKAAPSRPPGKKAGSRGGAAAPARAPSRRAATAAATAPVRRAPARAPQRARPKPKRNAGGQLIPLAVGRTAATVRHLPDSGLIVRMTRGRAWIAVLGVLLVGIVALNVVTLSFAASSGHIDEQIMVYEKENSMLRNRAAERLSTKRVRHEAARQGLVMSTLEQPNVLDYSPQDIATAAQRLAAAD
jgi:hypothetical protein